MLRLQKIGVATGPDLPASPGARRIWAAREWAASFWSRRFWFGTLGLGGFWLGLCGGCDPGGSTYDSAATIQIEAVPRVEELSNDPRVEAFVEHYLRTRRQATVKAYRILDKYIVPRPLACRYEVELVTTADETYTLTVDLKRDGSMTMPLGKFSERGSQRSRALDTSGVTAGPVGESFERGRVADSPSGSSGQSGAATTLPPEVRATRKTPTNPPPLVDASPSNREPATRAGDLTTQRNADPNSEKIEAYLQGWLQSEHKEEMESFLLRGREPTTFGADRYYTLITTVSEHGYNVTVDLYHDGRMRVFQSKKIY